jgi:hypothetical protein
MPRLAAAPVLYLDVDDTLVSWRGGNPHAGPGAREFLLWALERYEVRWLTTWCPNGAMEDRLLADLAKMLEIEPATIRGIRGFDWEGRSKLDGIAWLEHVLLDRPFLWVEDDYGVGERERAFLSAHRMLDRYRWVNVTERPDSLSRVHDELRSLPVGRLR